MDINIAISTALAETITNAANTAFISVIIIACVLRVIVWLNSSR